MVRLYLYPLAEVLTYDPISYVRILLPLPTQPSAPLPHCLNLCDKLLKPDLAFALWHKVVGTGPGEGA